jgi:nicotinamidase/pyrazinamidase
MIKRRVQQELHPIQMREESQFTVALASGDALFVIDVQNDFLLDGKAPMPGSDSLIPLLNRYIFQFQASQLPIFATRYCHPQNHCSFLENGGIWHPHCIAFSPGAEFPSSLELPSGAIIVSRGGDADKEVYSAFDSTDLAECLRQIYAKRLFIGGFSTEYSVLRTVRDALTFGYSAIVLEDAVCAFNLYPEDGDRALATIRALGAPLVRYESFQFPSFQ